MFLSLALLPMAFLAGVLVLWDVLFPRGSEFWGGACRLGNAGGFASLRPQSPQTKISHRPAVWRMGAGLVGFVVPCVLIWGMFNLNLAAVWWQNYQNHAEFYQHFQRSYAEWFWVNPLETLFAIGAPGFVLAWAGVWQFWKDRPLMKRADWGTVVAIVVTLGLLWISGKNRGEAARLWLVIFPCALWLSAPVLGSHGFCELPSYRGPAGFADGCELVDRLPGERVSALTPCRIRWDFGETWRFRVFPSS